MMQYNILESVIEPVSGSDFVGLTGKKLHYACEVTFDLSAMLWPSGAQVKSRSERIRLVKMGALWDYHS